MGLTFLTLKNVTNLDRMKIRNIFFGDKKFDREGCTAMRPQNRGILIFWAKYGQLELEGTNGTKQAANLFG